jgi:hypothetical protein
LWLKSGYGRLRHAGYSNYLPQKSSIHCPLSIYLCISIVDVGRVTVSETKEERGFAYLNLNGGDSWGYWHPVANPKILRNFKGEPNLLLEKVAPDYYYAALEKARKTKQEKAEADGGVTTSNGISYLAFTRIEDGCYHIGTYDHDADRPDIRSIPSRPQVIDFLKQHGLPMPDFLPHWSATYDFHTTKQIDFSRRWVNLYKPTEYFLNARPGQTEVPPTIRETILHIVNVSST